MARRRGETAPEAARLHVRSGDPAVTTQAYAALSSRVLATDEPEIPTVAAVMAGPQRDTRAVTALKAHVKNGRIVVDEPVDLPEGAEVSVYLYDAAADDLPPQERAALARALERGLAQADAGDLIDADVVLAELEQT